MLSPRSVLALALAAGLLALGPVPAPAQEFRGSITGRVTDGAGGAAVGARLTVTNTATNTPSVTTTDDSGGYTVPFLTPGVYQVTVEASGFKKLLRQGVEVRVADRITLDLELEVGVVSETVNVTADASPLQTSTASAGQVIDGRRISELPLSDGNPFVLSRLAPGIAYTGDLKFSRPFDNGGTSSIVADGAPGGNEFTLDGSPNMASGRRVAFVPPADAVQEFKVETAAFDGQQSHTAGATVNVTLKSGTNGFHGSLYEFLRNDVLSANDFFLNRTNLAANPSRDRDRDGKADRDPLRYNRYGGTVGGPVWLPKEVFGPLAYDGRDKTFFFFSYEGLKDAFPEPGLFTVPTPAERQGDFSALLPLGFVIYDPLTARQEGTRVRRDPIQCNGRQNVICPDRISAVARNYLSYYPLPNQPGDSQGRNNFIAGNKRTDDFYSYSGRLDQTVSEKQKAFFRYTQNNRVEARGNWTGEVGGILPTGNYLFRLNDAFTYDHLYTFSPTTILNARVGFSRFQEPSVRQNQGIFDPTTLGFSAQTASYFGDALYMPRFEIGSFSVLGDSLAGTTTHNIYSAQPMLTKIVGGHAFRFGYDFRSYRENSIPNAHAAGRYDFGTDFTRGPLDNSASASIGQQLASFMLGLPTGGLIDRNAGRSNQTLYHGVFVHDDWKVTRRLTLNLGLRYEYEGATTERFDRNVRGFDQTSANPLEAAARAAYAQSPIPQVPVADFKVKGGLLFAGDGGRGFWDADKNNIQPRVGLAYQATEKLVVRAGFGVYTVPFIIDGVFQNGFSQATLIVPTLNNGLTFRANLTDPFPDGVATPPGASAGLGTFVGRDIEFVPVERRSSQAQRWQFGLQYELPGQWLLEAAYVGNRGYSLTTTTDILNAVPRSYLSTSPVRDQPTIDFLTANVTNPFRGLVPGTDLNGTVVGRQQLLRPFPQFLRLRSRRDDGASIYHSGQLRAEKRFTRGFTLLASYTWSKFIEEVSFLNEVDTEYERRISGDDIPHRLVVSGIWELPFGRGRRWGTNWRGALDGLLGGWQVTGIWQAQSGRPIDLGNVYYNGDPSRLRATFDGAHVDGTTFDTSGFYFTDAAVQTGGVVDPAKQRNDTRIRLANNYRTFPSRLPGLRNQGLNLWDLSVLKSFAITEGVRLQLRGEFLNAFNTPVFGYDAANFVNPTRSDFGQVTLQTNLPRNVQIGLRLTF